MTTALDGAVELLDRSLAYTRVMLADVRPDHLDRPTPCAGWTLGRPARPHGGRPRRVHRGGRGPGRGGPGPADEPPGSRRCARRRARCSAPGRRPGRRREQVEVGDLGLDAPLLVATAALEITVHGWDVGQATGRRTRIPDDLAQGLLAVAQQVIDPVDRRTPVREPPAGPARGGVRRTPALLDRACAGSHD